MNVPSDIASALAAIDAFTLARAATLPAALVAMIGQAKAQPAPMRIVWVAEQIYANLASITDAPTQADARDLCAECALFAARYGWNQIADRGPAIARVVQRAPGVVGSPTDPEPLRDWTTPVVA